MAVTKLSDFKIGFSDQFFFDTNVWLLLFGTVADYQQKDQLQYSKFLEQLLTQDKPLFLTSLVLSEFSNVLLRRDFNQWIDSNSHVGKNFKKDFVGTDVYQNSVASITVAINKILRLPIVTLVSDNFNAVNNTSILEDFKKIDYNDAYIAELSRLNNYKIVTNDGDFKLLEAKVEIITTQV
ncbi:type II toxin-antitoxin system VapC family toxin [Flavobacterium tegetincola]|uniref:type II toxin-antitoxin system VapC family toxin n=1 Tax=Flavobacterium tegetincola TaxID=150172 RepID=UPI00047BB962|nr:PIN domain-containing protein [Flavobacterium tegetincola]